MANVTIAGEPRQIGDFSAFKAIYAGEIIAEVEEVWREIMLGAAQTKAELSEKKALRIPRLEARRQFAPRPLISLEREEKDDGTTIVREIPQTTDAGDVILGPDPLGHLSEADWQAGGNVLQIPSEPSDAEIYTVMAPRAIRLAKAHVAKLIGLLLTSNADLEKLDGEGPDAIDAAIAKVGDETIHRAKADELIRLVAAAVEICRDQLRDPFAEAAEAFGRLLESPTKETAQPMTIVETPESDGETGSSSDASRSSTESPAATDGAPATASIGSPSGESAVSPTG